MADILSILGTPQSPTTTSAKKVQHEVDGSDGQTGACGTTPAAAFNPILEQMIAASHGVVTKKEPEPSGNDHETVNQSEGGSAEAGSVVASFLGGQLMKMTGSPQGQIVNQTVSGESTKNQSGLVPQLNVNGTAEKAISSTGEAGISLARDPVLSPSASAARSNSASVNEEDATVQHLLSAKGVALLQNLSTLAPGQSLTPAEQGLLNAFEKLVATDTISTETPVEQAPESNTGTSKTQVVEGQANALPQGAKSQIPSYLVASEANNSTTESSESVRTSSTAKVTSESKSDGTGEGNTIATEILRLLSNVIGRSENVGGTVARSEQGVSTSSPSGDKEAGQTTVGTPINNSTAIPKTGEELLKLVQRSLGLPVRLIVSGTSEKSAVDAPIDKSEQATGNRTKAGDIPIGFKNGNAGSGVQLASLESAILGSSLVSDKAGKGLNPQSTVDAKTDVPIVALNNLSQRIEKTIESQPAGVVNPEAKPVRTKVNTSVPRGEKAIASTTSEVKPVIASESAQTRSAQISGTKQEVKEDSEKKVEPERVPASTKNNSSLDAAQKASVETKIQPASSAPAPKDHVEFLKNQQLIIHPKIEKQDIPMSAQVKLAPLPPEILRSVQDQVANEISLKLMDNVSEMKMVLKPESLGEVGISVRMEEGSMVARIDVNQSQVRSALEVNLHQLRDALASKGIQVDRIDITTSSDSSSRESNGSYRAKGKSSSKRRMDVEGVDAYESTRYLGYNTMEYLI